MNNTGQLITFYDPSAGLIGTVLILTAAHAAGAHLTRTRKATMTTDTDHQDLLHQLDEDAVTALEHLAQHLHAAQRQLDSTRRALDTLVIAISFTAAFAATYLWLTV
jgi:hypothetical protein